MKMITALAILLSASTSFANQVSCAHQSSSGLFAKTNPVKAQTKTATATSTSQNGVK